MNDHRPEERFQRHIAEYLRIQHGYAVLEAEDITDKEYYFATPLLLSFIRATQADTLRQLEAEYDTAESQNKIITALKTVLATKPL